MTTAELDQLVAQIGDEILTQLQSRPGSVCPVCQQPYPGRSATAVPRPTPVTAPNSIAAYIDHTLLKPEATESDIIRVCDEALQHGFASVCINPDWVPTVAARLAGSPVKVCTVVGFPLGATTTEAKLHETAAALRCGAQEIDMVQNVGALRSGNALRVAHDIAAIVRLAHSAGALVKVIFETCLLDEAQKKLACRLAAEAGADFVKTSTGFSTGGATVEDVALMRANVPAAMGVKASGGVRTLEDLRKMVAAGANRIGASASVAIVNGAVNAPQTGY